MSYRPDDAEEVSEASAVNHTRSQQQLHAPDNEETTENAPLLARDDGIDDGERAEDSLHRNPRVSSSRASRWLNTIRSKGSSKGGRLARWPSFLALLLLSIVIVLILVGGFLAPSTLEEYSEQAARFEPVKLSITSFTATGVVARVVGDFSIDANRVQKKSVRDFGRFATWIAYQAETGDARLQASLPEQDDLVLGTASVPPIKVNIQDGHTTRVEFLTAIDPGSSGGLRRIANDWIDGRMGRLRIQAVAKVPLKSGIISLGKQTIAQSLTFEAGSGGDGHQLPSMPKYAIQKLNFRQVMLPNGFNGLAAEASINVSNEYPVDFKIPPMGFAILVDDCTPDQAQIMVADATTEQIHVKPNQNVTLDVTGFIRQIPQQLLQPCPRSHNSPLDVLVGNYIHGKEATVYVRGSDPPSLDSPSWLTDLIFGMTVPIPVPGQTFGDLIKNFSMSDVHFSLPNFFAEPGTPDAQPKISATVKAIIGLPQQIRFPLGVHRIRADADVYYHGEKLGYLDLRKWQAARSKDITEKESDQRNLQVISEVDKAPLNITNEGAFQEVVKALLGGRKNINLHVKAKVDVDLETALGTFVVREIPAKGNFPVKAAGGADLSKLAPSVGGLRIVETTRESLGLEASVNFTNPTPYSANVPFMDVHLLVNDTIMGHVVVEGVAVKPENNTRVPVRAIWEPGKLSGEKGALVGRTLLSQYLSGYNTSLVLKAHENSIPSKPSLGRALEAFEFQIPTPRLGSSPGKGDGKGKRKGPHFIEDTTMHVLTSTASFVLNSPLKHSTIYLTSIDATAFYHDDPVGRIVYQDPLEVPPGSSETPRLPVDWSLGSVGYDAIKKALGGMLKLNAFADVGVRIGKYEVVIWFEGKGIGAKVRV